MAFERRTRAEGDHRAAMAGADAHDIADFLGGKRIDHGIRQVSLVMGLAAAVMLAHCGNGRYAIAEEVTKLAKRHRHPVSLKRTASLADPAEVVALNSTT